MKYLSAKWRNKLGPIAFQQNTVGEVFLVCIIVSLIIINKIVSEILAPTNLEIFFISNMLWFIYASILLTFVFWTATRIIFIKKKFNDGYFAAMQVLVLPFFVYLYYAYIYKIVSQGTINIIDIAALIYLGFFAIRILLFFQISEIFLYRSPVAKDDHINPSVAVVISIITIAVYLYNLKNPIYAVTNAFIISSIIINLYSFLNKRSDESDENQGRFSHP